MRTASSAWERRNYSLLMQSFATRLPTRKAWVAGVAAHSSTTPAVGAALLKHLEQQLRRSTAPQLVRVSSPYFGIWDCRPLQLRWRMREASLQHWRPPLAAASNSLCSCDSHHLQHRRVDGEEFAAVFPILCRCADHMVQLRLMSFEASATATGERRERDVVCGRAGKLWKRGLRTAARQPGHISR
jgi:hypothetical protein